MRLSLTRTGGGPLLGIITEVLGALGSLFVGGAATSPGTREVVGCFRLLLIDLSRFGKGPYQRTGPPPLLDCLSGPRSVGLVPILGAALGTWAKTSLYTPPGSSRDRGRR